MNYLEKSFQEDSYGWYYLEAGSYQGKDVFFLNMKYYQEPFGVEYVDTDALYLYNHLKEYFKGTPYE